MLQEQARNRNRNLSEKTNQKKREYGRSRCKNMSKEDKQKLKEYE